MEIITILVLAIVIIVILLEVIRLSLLCYTSKQLAKEVTPASQKGTEGTTTLLVVGDSLAYGTGASASEYSLTGRLAKDFPTVTIENHSKNGANIKDVISQLENIGDQTFAIVVICVGGIDTVSLTPMTRIKKQLVKLYQKAKDVSTEEVIHISVNNTGLVPMFRFPLNILLSSRSKKVSQLSQAQSQEFGVIHIPLFACKEKDPLYKKYNCYASDKIHPNDQGYEIWYKGIAETIRSYLEKSNPKSK